MLSQRPLDRRPTDRQIPRHLTLRNTIRDVADQLGQLNPYGPPLDTEPLLKIEKENFDPDTGQQLKLYCLSIASKRYAPFRKYATGRPVLVGKPGKYKRSEHGLGHLLDPTDPDPDHPQDGFRDQWWLRLLDDEHGLPVDEPDWLARPAVGRLSVSSKQEEASFANHNADLPYDQRTRPFNFAMMAFPKPGQPVQGALVASLDKHSQRWNQLDWHQRGECATAAVQIRTGDPTFSIPGTVVVRSYRDDFHDYQRHPEAKAAGPDGHPCRPDTRGLLQPLTVTASTIVRIGKETNRLAAIEDLADGDRDRPVVYQPTERRCRGCTRAVTGKRQWCSEACRKATARRPPHQ